uniref:Uncharacterized protein n=1 Tax=viral metagenome TaxID=1070528 RepID=A0A6H2A3W6_9ZZZZ
MLLTTYDPSAKATCPKCGFVSCLNTGGNLAFGPQYMDFYHKDCGTSWRMYLNGGPIVVLNTDESIIRQSS